MINNEPIKYNFQKLYEERQQPMKDLQAGFEEIRKAEEEAKRQKEMEEAAKLPPEPLTTDEQLQLLSKAVADLAVKLNGKGEKHE
ncbi:hypothetical protein [Metabacillus sediminilitoris]|uniref:Uncharacterized protein n=1 Tax=Metabacillus sediminilitoris TaxID=2567941 RepID=A0A4S4C4I1_9BACI|nr:hypothetical protein [Metabacillus sediminilitoris]QGQ47249.1 hypothetical protein GMB29_19540 [Metabacillus sediminilitoris]THF80591.1 hypothetical protein E6W99_09335 [Metabacillus sediminilitoris]